MCGIIGYIGTQDPKGVLLDGLKRLEYRGYDSAGIAVLEPDSVQVYRCEGKLQGLEERLTNVHFRGTLGIGHTRWATHGAPTETNAHPHRVGPVTLVHNGIIENYREHRQRLEAAGRRFESETDSEIVAHLFEEQIQQGKSLQAAVESTLPHLTGSYAFVVFSDLEPDLMIGVRNGAPLLLGVGDGENYVASDVQAILHRTKRIVYLENHQLAVCTRGGIQLRDQAGEPVPLDIRTLQWSAEQTEKNGYRHYMLKEIHEQPQAIAQTIESHVDHQKGVVAFQNLGISAKEMRSFRRISIVACGTARHAALVGQYYLERFAGIPANVDYGSEFRYRNPILEQDTLLVLISQSGETADTLAALQEGKRRGVATLAICNVRESSLAREAASVVYTNAGPEIGVASTKAFTTQLSVLYMLAVQLGHTRGFLSEELAKELTQDLLRLPLLVQDTLTREKQIEAIAEANLDRPFFFFMGRDVLYPIAQEGALKLKEISYAHAEGYAAGELKHGPIALVDRQTVVLALSPQNTPTKNAPDASNWSGEVLPEKMRSNIQEVKSRGGHIVCVVSEGDTEFAQDSQKAIYLPKASWGLNPVLASIPMQLFAYYMALHRGTDVDKPRNLAKSVTVE
ncbi:glutamine--fructose-6-phosphate transaminase (isomerizing) [bacterium]|nr:glutamine--fructose-6-phosphate transaminase (isomerizing) [bacterium]